MAGAVAGNRKAPRRVLIRRGLAWMASVTVNVGLGYLSAVAILALLHILAFVLQYSDESWFAWSGKRVGPYDDGVRFALYVRIAVAGLVFVFFWLVNLMIRARFRPAAWLYWLVALAAFLLPSVVALS